MNRELNVDPAKLTICIDSYGRQHRLDKEISRGGQGVVFKTLVPNVVVKFELADNHLVSAEANDKYMELRFLPIPDDLHVTMPQATLREYAGYVMTMMSDMVPFGDAFDGPIEADKRITTTFIEKMQKEDTKCFFSDYVSSGGERRRLEAFMKSATLLSQLHAQGLVYCDYSQNNVFISKNRDYCHVWLIDADNLAYESKTLKSTCFTPGLAAPEVALFYQEIGEQKALEECFGRGNSFASDVYTFAICLFKQLAGCSPFKGKAYQFALKKCDNYEEADSDVDIGRFAYIADEEDDSNRSESLCLPLDIVLTSELKRLFQQTFCQEGRDNCLSRPCMNEWAIALAQANDITVHCDACGLDYINNDERECPWCGARKPVLFIAEAVYFKQNVETPILWKFCHEMKDNEIINLPLRLARGYDADEIDRRLLTIVRESGKLTLRIDITNPDLKVSFSEDGNKFHSYSTINTRIEQFYLLCENKSRALNVLVKCKVVS